MRDAGTGCVLGNIDGGVVGAESRSNMIYKSHL